MTTFQQEIVAGIPAELPSRRTVGTEVNRAPKRKDILSAGEKRLALENALRYFPKEWHAELAPEFLEELKEFGRIYMYRFKPSYDMHARGIEEYPCKTPQAAAIMLMIQNNLDPAVAQHPEELITYGGNGAVFQNWAQYLLTMKYLSEMTEEQNHCLELSDYALGHYILHGYWDFLHRHFHGHAAAHRHRYFRRRTIGNLGAEPDLLGRHDCLNPDYEFSSSGRATRARHDRRLNRRLHNAPIGALGPELCRALRDWRYLGLGGRRQYDHGPPHCSG